MAAPEQIARNFLNFEERRSFNFAMEKLAHRMEFYDQLAIKFKELDKGNTSVVSDTEFLNVLSTGGMISMLSSQQLHVLFKSFCAKRSSPYDTVNYGQFLRELQLKSNLQRPHTFYEGAPI